MGYFDHLTTTEVSLLKDAIALIAVLIAGADGKIDRKEKEWAAKIAGIRTYTGEEEMQEFYKDVTHDLDEKIEVLIDELPGGVEERTQQIASRLSQLNEILPKLEPEIGYKMYKGYVSFAKHVAKSSGGFLRIFSIGREESKLVGLSMIEPIEPPSE